MGKLKILEPNPKSKEILLFHIFADFKTFIAFFLSRTAMFRFHELLILGYALTQLVWVSMINIFARHGKQQAQSFSKHQPLALKVKVFSLSFMSSSMDNNDT